MLLFVELYMAAAEQCQNDSFGNFDWKASATFKNRGFTVQFTDTLKVGRIR
jgi:hypothetical protein